MTARPPHCPRPRGRGPPVPPAPPAGPNSPHPEPRGERGAETDGEGGVAAMQLRCVRGTGQSWRQLRDRPRPSSPGAERPNGRAGPDARAKPRPLSPLFWRPGFPSPFFFLMTHPSWGPLHALAVCLFPTRLAPSPPRLPPGNTPTNAHTPALREHTDAGRAQPGSSTSERDPRPPRGPEPRQLSAPRFHSNPLPLRFFFIFVSKPFTSRDILSTLSTAS